jgi:hypothetical protein
MVSKMDDHVGLLVDDVLANPLKVNSRHAGLGLCVWDHQVRTRFGHQPANA